MNGKLHALVGAIIGICIILAFGFLLISTADNMLLNILVSMYTFGSTVVGGAFVVAAFGDEFSEQEVKKMGWQSVVFFTLLGFFSFFWS